MPRRLLVRIAPFWIACVLIGSFLPGDYKKALGTVTPYEEASAGDVRWQHRATHFVVFGSTALLLSLVGRTKSERIAACLSSIALGLGIEAGQHYILGIGWEPWDIRDDTLAALIVFALSSAQRVRVLLVQP